MITEVQVLQNFNNIQKRINTSKILVMNCIHSIRTFYGYLIILKCTMAIL